MADQDRLTTETEDGAVKSVDPAPETPSETPVKEKPQAADILDQKPIEPKVEPAKPTPAKPAPARKSGGGFFATVLGGVIAAGAGYALAVYAPIPGLPTAQPSFDPAQMQALAGRVAALEAKPAPVVDETLTDRLAALEGQIASQPAPTSEANDDLLASVERLSQGLAGFQTRLTALEARPATVGTAALSPDATQEIEALRAGIEAQAAEAEARIAAAQEQAGALQSQAEALAKQATMRAALGRLQAALDTGAPFVSVLGDLQGVEIEPSLADFAQSGVPSLQALELAFPPAARDALSAALHEDMGASWGERMTSFLQSATSARSLTPREGTDPDAILSRAEAALKAGDVHAALTEIATLPEAGRSAMAGFVTLAEQRLAAVEAAAKLATAVEG